MMMRKIRTLLGRPNPPVVSVLRLSGIIGQLGGLRPGLAMQNTAALIERAFAPRGQAAVALVVNSPGGSPVQSSLIGRRIRALAEEKKVPVVAFVEDVAASGGYWLAAAADEIFVDESSIVGSIGVVSAGFGFQELISRFGIERRVHTAGEHKAMLDPFRPEDPDEVARLEGMQRDIHEVFKEWVRTRRAGRLKAPEAELFTGAFWTGRRGVELGLADGIGDVRSVMRARFGDKVVLRPVAVRRPFWQRGFSIGGGIGGGLAADAAAGLVGAAEERALWARYGL
ncbi:MAG TPA: S49 family peptidase [Azospirillaceae bacterium]|nr:S49 family peptidase [Azospirillaceae bacterium]